MVPSWCAMGVHEIHVSMQDLMSAMDTLNSKGNDKGLVNPFYKVKISQVVPAHLDCANSLTILDDTKKNVGARAEIVPFKKKDARAEIVPFKKKDDKQRWKNMKALVQMLKVCYKRL